MGDLWDEAIPVPVGGQPRDVLESGSIQDTLTPSTPSWGLRADIPHGFWAVKQGAAVGGAEGGTPQQNGARALSLVSWPRPHFLRSLRVLSGIE